MAVLSPERIAEIRQMLDIGSKDFEFMRDALVETLAAHDHWLKAVRNTNHYTHSGHCQFDGSGYINNGDMEQDCIPDCDWLLSQEGK